MRRAVLLWPCLAAALLGACLGDLEPDVGPLINEPCSDVDSTPQVDVSFGDNLLAVTFVNPPGECLACHDPGASVNPGYSLGGLDLTSHAGLIAGGVNSGSDIVVPGFPCESVLTQKLRPSPPFGARMPGNGPPFLEDAAVQQVADWIAEGANEN